MSARRGTSNSNERGNAEDRRRRREWLVETYRADVDLDVNEWANYCAWIDGTPEGPKEVVAACRCYRCGVLLSVESVTVDRIIPGCQGGTYRRTNIRPACSRCNSETGGATRRTAA